MHYTLLSLAALSLIAVQLTGKLYYTSIIGCITHSCAQVFYIMQNILNIFSGIWQCNSFISIVAVSVHSQQATKPKWRRKSRSLYCIVPKGIQATGWAWKRLRTCWATSGWGKELFIYHKKERKSIWVILCFFNLQLPFLFSLFF